MEVATAPQLASGVAAATMSAIPRGSARFLVAAQRARAGSNQAQSRGGEAAQMQSAAAQFSSPVSAPLATPSAPSEPLFDNTSPLPSGLSSPTPSSREGREREAPRSILKRRRAESEQDRDGASTPSPSFSSPGSGSGRGSGGSGSRVSFRLESPDGAGARLVTLEAVCEPSTEFFGSPPSELQLARRRTSALAMTGAGAGNAGQHVRLKPGVASAIANLCSRRNFRSGMSRFGCTALQLQQAASGAAATTANGVAKTAPLSASAPFAAPPSFTRGRSSTHRAGYRRGATSGFRISTRPVSLPSSTPVAPPPPRVLDAKESALLARLREANQQRLRMEADEDEQDEDSEDENESDADLEAEQPVKQLVALEATEEPTQPPAKRQALAPLFGVRATASSPPPPVHTSAQEEGEEGALYLSPGSDSLPSSSEEEDELIDPSLSDLESDSEAEEAEEPEAEAEEEEPHEETHVQHQSPMEEDEELHLELQMDGEEVDTPMHDEAEDVAEAQAQTQAEVLRPTTPPVVHTPHRVAEALDSPSRSPLLHAPKKKRDGASPLALGAGTISSPAASTAERNERSPAAGSEHSQPAAAPIRAHVRRSLLSHMQDAAPPRTPAPALPAPLPLSDSLDPVRALLDAIQREASVVLAAGAGHQGTISIPAALAAAALQVSLPAHPTTSPVQAEARVEQGDAKTKDAVTKEASAAVAVEPKDAVAVVSSQAQSPDSPIALADSSDEREVSPAASQQDEEEAPPTALALCLPVATPMEVEKKADDKEANKKQAEKDAAMQPIDASDCDEEHESSEPVANSSKPASKPTADKTAASSSSSRPRSVPRELLGLNDSLSVHEQVSERTQRRRKSEQDKEQPQQQETTKRPRGRPPSRRVSSEPSAEKKAEESTSASAVSAIALVAPLAGLSPSKPSSSAPSSSSASVPAAPSSSIVSSSAVAAAAAAASSSSSSKPRARKCRELDGLFDSLTQLPQGPRRSLPPSSSSATPASASTQPTTAPSTPKKQQKSRPSESGSGSGSSSPPRSGSARWGYARAPDGSWHRIQNEVQAAEVKANQFEIAHVVDRRVSEESGEVQWLTTFVHWPDPVWNVWNERHNFEGFQDPDVLLRDYRQKQQKQTQEEEDEEQPQQKKQKKQAPRSNNKDNKRR